MRSGEGKGTNVVALVAWPMRRRDRTIGRGEGGGKEEVGQDWQTARDGGDRQRHKDVMGCHGRAIAQNWKRKYKCEAAVGAMGCRAITPNWKSKGQCTVGCEQNGDTTGGEAEWVDRNAERKRSGRDGAGQRSIDLACVERSGAERG